MIKETYQIVYSNVKYLGITKYTGKKIRNYISIAYLFPVLHQFTHDGLILLLSLSGISMYLSNIENRAAINCSALLF